MTKGTDSRNITTVVREILGSNQVDNLKLEMDLVGAFTRYVNARDAGSTPAEARSLVVGGALGFIGISDTVRERARMKQIIEDTLRLNVNEDKPDWVTVIDFCLKMEAQGQTVKQYQNWREQDVFNSPKAHQIDQKPLVIKGTWPQAFPRQQVPMTTGSSSGFYA